MPILFTTRAYSGVLTGAAVPAYTNPDHARVFGSVGALAVQAVVDQVVGASVSYQCVLEHSADGRTWFDKQILIDSALSTTAANSLAGADRGDSPLLSFVRLRSQLAVPSGAASARVVIDVCGRDRASRLDPRVLSPVVCHFPGAFSATSSPNVWHAEIGDPASATADPARTALQGCPVFDYSAATGEVHLGSSMPLSVWGGGATSDRHVAARVDLRGISTSDPSIWLNAAAISDSLSQTGLHFRKSGASTFATYYDWDTAVRQAEVDITSLLVAGEGPVTVQGRRAGGDLAIKASAPHPG